MTMKYLMSLRNLYYMLIDASKASDGSNSDMTKKSQTLKYFVDFFNYIRKNGKKKTHTC